MERYDSFKCAFCGDKNFRRMNQQIEDYCLSLRSVQLPVIGGITIDVYIQPQIEEEKRFCGFGCLDNWLQEKKYQPRLDEQIK